MSAFIIVGINILCFDEVKKYVQFKSDTSRNQGLKQFENIYQDRKIGVEFIIANLIPLMSMELFVKIELTTFFNNIVMLVVLLIIVNHAQSFAFNPYLYALGYRIYKTKDDDEAVLLIKKSDFGTKRDYQAQFKFEEFDNSKIYVLKQK